MQEFFNEEFQNDTEDENDYLAEKKSVESYYQNILQDDIENKRISTRNWSGYDVLSM